MHHRRVRAAPGAFVAAQDGPVGRVFAVGDASDYHLKQGYLALLQGDVAGDHIAADITGDEPELAFEPLSVRALRQVTDATFAPLPEEGKVKHLDVLGPDPSGEGHFQVGVSPLWRASRRMLGVYLPWRFGRGKPFHSSVGWKTMDFGLSFMSRLLGR